jgi:predicted transcriptional regulator
MKSNTELNGVFKVLANPIRYDLFRYIASNGRWFPTDLVSSLNLSLKQYYGGMMALSKEGLIVKRGQKYFLTSFGRVVASCCDTIQEGSKSRWITKLIDENRDGLTAEQQQELGTLIGDNSIREIVVSVK